MGMESMMKRYLALAVGSLLLFEIALSQSIYAIGDPTINQCETKSYTLSIVNSTGNPMTDFVVTVRLDNLNGFSYVSGTSSLDINGGGAFCSADPQQSGSDLIWNFGSLCANQALSAGDVLNVTFLLETSCNASSGSLNTDIAFQMAGSPFSDNTAALNIQVLPGGISITKTPDVIPQIVGQQATFTIQVENTGIGTIENVEITDVMGSGLIYLSSTGNGNNNGQTTTWTQNELAALASMGPGDIVTVDITALVNDCTNLETNANARYGCDPGASNTCFDTSNDGGTATAAVRRLVRTPHIDFSPPDISFTYCSDSQHVSVNVTNLGDGDAHDVTTIVDFSGLMVDLSSVTATPVNFADPSFEVVYNLAQTRFEANNPVPPSGTYTLEFDLSYLSWCGGGFPEQDLLWKKEYKDVCGQLFYPPVEASVINAPSDAPSLSVTLSGAPPIVQIGAPITYDITSNYSGLTVCGSGPGSSGDVLVTSTLDTGLVVTDAGGGNWMPGGDGTGGTITWAYTPPATLSTIVTVQTPGLVDCETYCNESLTHVISADVQDCCGCDLSSNASQTTFIECEEGVDSEKTASGPTERCGNTTYSNTYDFSDSSTVLLNDLVFEEHADQEQTYDPGSLSVNLSGGPGDITPLALAGLTDTTPGVGGSLLIDFSGAIAVPLAGERLTITYDLTAEEAAFDACTDTSFLSWSSLNTNLMGTQCLADGIIHEAVETSVSVPSMDLTVTGLGDIVNVCETQTVTISLSQTSTNANPRDVQVVLSASNYYAVNPAATICGGGVMPVACEPERDASGNYVWTFNDRFSAYGANATLQLDVQKRCNSGDPGEKELVATIYYDENCTDNGNIDHTCSLIVSDSPTLLLAPDLLIEKTPEIFFATTSQVTWQIYVTNRGTGTAFDVWVDDVLGSDLIYTNASVDGMGYSIDPNMDHTGGAINGASIQFSEIPAGTRREINLTADVIGCTNLTNVATTSWGCMGGDCQDPVSDASTVAIPSPNLLATNAVITPMNACENNRGFITLRNAGQTNCYDLRVTQSLPDGLFFSNGSARWRLNGGSWNGPNAVYDPNPATSPMQWTDTEIPALAILAVGDTLEIEFDLVSDCSFSGGTVSVITQFSNPCGQVFTTPQNDFTVAFLAPDVTVTKTRANDPIDCGGFLQWTISVTNNSGYMLPILWVEDTLDAAYSYSSSVGDPPFTVDNGMSVGQMVTWELRNVNPGDTVSLTLNAVADSAPCSPDLGNSVNVYWGCGSADGSSATKPGVNAPDDSLCLQTNPVAQTVRTETREPDLDFAPNGITFDPNPIANCDGSTILRIEMENTGPTDAYNVDVVVTLPDGLLYLAGTSVSYLGPDDSGVPGIVADPAIAGNTLTFYDLGDKGNSLASTIQADGGNDTLVLELGLGRDPDACDIIGDVLVEYRYYDCCDDAQYSESNSVYLATNTQPIIGIDMSPNSQLIAPGDHAIWTITLTNSGDAPATAFMLTNQLGSGFSNISVTSGQGVDGNNWPGNLGTWTIPTIAANGGIWEVTLEAEVGSGSLLSTVNGTSSIESCIGGVCTNTHFPTTYAYVAGFDMSKSVDKSSANVGEALTYSLDATFANTETTKNVTLRDNLPGYVEAISETAGGAHDTVKLGTPVVSAFVEDGSSQTVTWGTPLADFSGGAVLDYTINARIRNDVGEDDVFSTLILTNNLEVVGGFDIDFGTVDGDIHFVPDNRTDSTVVSEPDLVLTKTFSPTSADAGDVITITLEVSNTGDGTAFEVEVTDILNDQNGDGLVDGSDTLVFRTDAGSITPMTTPTGWTFNENNIGADNATVAYTSTSGAADIPAGESRTFVFTAVVNTEAVSGSTHMGHADALCHSLDNGDSEFNNDTFDRQPSAEGSDDLVIADVVAPVKMLTATSEDNTDPSDSNISSNPPVAIGEVVSVEIVFQLPEGTTENVMLYERLTNLNANIAWGSYVVGSATLSRSTTALTSSLDPGSINASTAGVPVSVDAQISESVGSTYSTISLDLGSVINTASDGANETYSLNLDVVVLNNSTSSGDSLVDYGRIRYRPAGGSDQFVNSSAVTMHVAEPVPTISTELAPSSGDAGDTIHFTITLSNTASGANAATAFDWDIENVLPATFENITGLTLDVGTTGATITIDPNFPASTSTLTATIDQLDPGESVSIEFDADLIQGVNFGEMITDTSTFTTTSLPGNRGTANATPGSTGTANGERNGSGGVNDLAGSDPDSVTINLPTLSKDILNYQNFYPIEDQPEFEVRTGVPAGTNNDFLISDTLPVGLIFVANSLNVVVPSGANSSNGAMVEANGSFFNYDSSSRSLTLDFGTLTTPSAGNIIITYATMIENAIGNQDGVTLRNSVLLEYEDPTDPAATVTVGPVDNTRLVNIGEPNLLAVKTVQTGATGSDAGDVISWRIDLTNNGNTNAYQVYWADILPDGLFSISNATLFISGGNVYLNGTTTALETVDLSITTTFNTNDTLSLPLLEIQPGALLRVEFDSVMMETVQPSEVLSNEVTFDYTSLVDGGRDNSTAPGNVDDDNDTDLNNYEESTSESVTVDASIAIDKTIPSMQTTYAVGELVTYRIQVDLIEGVTTNLHVYDNLPVGLTYDSHNIAVGQAEILIGNPSYDTRLGTDQEVHFFFGDVTNPSTSGSNDFIEIEISAKVDNMLAIQSGFVLNNGEEIDSNDVYLTFGPGSTQIDFDEDGLPGNGNQGVPITVVEPALSINKTVNLATQTLGDAVTYTINVLHDGGSNSDAFDVRISDSLPMGLTYIPDSCTLPPADVSVSGQDLAFNKSSITRGAPDNGSWSFSYQARVDSSAQVGITLTNDALLEWASIPGATGGPNHGRNGDDGLGGLNNYVGRDSASTTPTSDAIIDAQKTVALVVDGGAPGVVDPGDTLEYTITLTNGPDPVTNVMFTDPIPNNSAYVAPSLISSKGIIDDTGDPLSVDIGSLASAEAVTITFRVLVDGSTPAGTVISNQGTIDSDETVPELTDEDGIDENGDQPTDVRVGGPAEVENALYVHKQVVWISDNDLSGDVSPSDTLRYLLTIENHGDETLTNVLVSDTIPVGLTYVGASATIHGAPPNNINVLGSGVSIAIPSLLPSLRQSFTATFDVTIDNPLVDYNGGANDETFLNQAALDSDQTDPGESDGNGDPSDGNQPTQITAYDDNSGTPIIDVEKRWMLLNDLDGDGLVDPNDTVIYTIMVLNTGGAMATDLRLTDTISANTTVLAGTVTTDRGIVVTEDPVNINIGMLEPGGLVQVHFQVSVDGGTPDGTIIPNQAMVSGDDGISEVSDDNGNDNDGKNPTLTPIDSGGGSSSGAPGALNKDIFSTSEPGSTSTDVLIGERITFRVSVSVPVGTLREATLVDTLPSGMLYLPNTARLARMFETGMTSSENPGGINTAAAGNYVALADGSDLVQMGQDLELFLGDIINSDNDANDEIYILELQVLVQNTVTNLAGATLNNQATITYLNGLGQVQTLSPVSQGVTITEPDLVLGKTALPTMVTTAGGDVTFTLIVTNPAGSHVGPGFDVQITDTLSPEWTALTVNSIVTAAGVSGVVDNSSGTVLDISVATFPVDGVLTITYTASVPGILAPGILTNTVFANWTSTPGQFGTGDGIPGDAGDSDGERTGGGGVNSYAASAQADVVIGETNITKTVLNPQERYAIGELVHFQVQVSLPPTAFLENARIEDILNNGFSYQGGLVIDWQGMTSSTNPTDFTRLDNTPGPGEETLTLDLGGFANPQVTVQTLTLTYAVQVDNLLINQEGTDLGNAVAFSYEDPGGGIGISQADSQSITVGEAHLTLDKTITSGFTGLDAGDPISFQVVIGNDGTTTAFDVVLTDIFPAGLEAATALTVFSTNGGAETPTFMNNGSDWSTSAFDIPVGASVGITFSAILSNTVLPGQNIQNSVSATFSSQDGSQSGERDGSTPNSNQDDDTDLDNYGHFDSAPVLVVADTIAITKAFYPDPVNTNYTIGDSVGFRILVSLNEGMVDDLIVTDTIPVGLRFESAIVGGGNLGIIHNYSGTASVVGQVASFDLGQVINPANGVNSDDYVTIDLIGTVENIAGNQDGTFLENHAELSFTGALGPETRDFDSDAATPGVQGLELELVEPDLQLQKSVSAMDIWPGVEVEYTLTIDHTAASRVDAFDIVIVDTLPVGITYVTGSANLTPTSVVGQVVTFTVPVLTLLDDQFSIIYNGLVDDNSTLGVPLQNTAIGTYSTQPGDHPGERDGSDGVGGLNDLETNSANAQIIPTRPVVTMLKVDNLDVDLLGDGNASPGDTLGYQVIIENSGNAPVTQVVFTDTPDPYSSIVPGSITSTQGTISGGQDGTAPIVIEIGTLAASSNVTVSFQAVIDDSVDPAFRILANQAILSSEELPDLPSDDPDDPTGDDDPTATPIVQIDLGVTKMDDPDPIALGNGDVTFTVLVDNTGPSAATEVLVVDQLPAELTYVNSTTSAGSIIYDGVTHTVTVDIGNLAVDAQVTATVTTTPTVTGEFNNSVSVSALEHDLNPDNDSDQEDTTVVEGIDLWLTKTVNNPNPDYQETITFTVRITNEGPSTATGIVVADTWPAELVYVSHTSTAGSYDHASHEWSIASIAENAFGELHIVARVNGLGTPINLVEIIAHNEVDLDSTPGNGDPSEDDIASVEIAINDALDLTLQKWVIAENPYPGSRVIYNLEVQNLGPAPSFGTIATDHLPGGIEFISSMATQGVYEPVSGEWDIGHMDPGDLHTLTIRAEIRRDTPSGIEIMNVASVTSDLVDIDISNNDGNAAISTVVGVPTLNAWLRIALLGLMMATGLFAMKRHH